VAETKKVERRRLTPKIRLEEIAEARARHVEAIKKLDAKRETIIAETKAAAAEMLEQLEMNTE
jgi:hypothetical protein